MKTYVKKWLRETSEMNYSITARKIDWNDAYNNKQDRKHNNVNTNDDVDTPHFDDRVAHHNMLTLSIMAQAESCTFHPISIPSICALVVSL